MRRAARRRARPAKAILARIRRMEIADGFTLRDIHQKGWANLSDRDQVKAGLELLTDLDWLAAKTGTDWRPSSRLLRDQSGALA